MLRIQLICSLHAPNNKSLSIVLIQRLIKVHSFSSALKTTLSLTVVKFIESHKDCPLPITFEKHIV